MGLGSFFSNLFGGGSNEPPAGEGVEYQGYTIRPTPQRRNGQFQTVGIIEKTFPDGPKTQQFIRADTHASYDDACAHIVSKGQQIINEQGDRLFQ